MSDYSIAIKIGGQIESSFNSSVQIAMNGLSALGAASVAGMTAAARGIGAIGRSSVQVGKDFETAMSSASATALASEEDFAKMKQAAMEMGKTTSKTATESAQALEYMALAGWDVDTSISALPSVLKMSEASGMELGRTSDLVTDSMACAWRLCKRTAELSGCCRQSSDQVEPVRPAAYGSVHRCGWDDEEPECPHQRIGHSPGRAGEPWP